MRSNNIKPFFITILLIVCINLSPRIVIENYGNWRSLSFSVKGAYITGVWDSLLIQLTEDQAIEKQVGNVLNCLLEKDFTIGDLVEEIDLLYESPKYKSFSPVTLMKEKILIANLGVLIIGMKEN